MRLLVSQGELGVIHPNNSSAYTEMMTFGASPCVIIAIRKGSTAILGHVHRANSLAALEDQLADILGDAIPKQAKAEGVISTEKAKGIKLMEIVLQARVVERLKGIFVRLGIAYKLSWSHSAAIWTKGKLTLSDDKTVAGKMTKEEFGCFLKWAQAYDKEFGKLVDQLPMGIRVGVNSETPAEAMVRLYSKGLPLIKSDSWNTEL